MENNILKKLENGLDGYSKSQKLIAKYIIENYDKAAFMTAARLGATINVSESTVVRFAAELGFDGYPAMQKAIQGIIRNKLTSVQRIEVANTRLRDNNLLDMVLQADVDNITKTLAEIDHEEFNQVVDAILKARRIYIIGVRSAATLTNFIGFYFNLIFPDVRVVGTISISEIFEQIIDISEEDVLIAASFPRYSTRTLKAMHYAVDRSAQVIGITDSHYSPLKQYASHMLYAKSDMVSFADSLVAPFSLVNALIVAISMRKNEEISKTLDRLEKIWDEYEVYEKLDNE